MICNILLQEKMQKRSYSEFFLNQRIHSDFRVTLNSEIKIERMLKYI